MFKIGLNPCFDRIYFQFVSFLDFEDFLLSVSILVLIEFIFNILKKVIKGNYNGLNPCFDRIYFQYQNGVYISSIWLSLNPCFDRIYFQ